MLPTMRSKNLSSIQQTNPVNWNQTSDAKNHVACDKFFSMPNNTLLYKKQFHFNDISIDVSIVYSINTVCKLSVRFPCYEKNCAFIKNSLGAKVYIFGTQISFICRRSQIRSADGLIMSFSNNCSIFAQETNKQQQTLYSLLYSLYTFKYGEKELN